MFQGRKFAGQNIRPYVMVLFDFFYMSFEHLLSILENAHKSESFKETPCFAYYTQKYNLFDESGIVIHQF